MREGLYWIGLAIASSPALVGLSERLVAEPIHRHSLLVGLLVLLLGTSGRSDAARGGVPHPRVGGGLLVLGFALQLVGAAAAAGFVAQLGMAVCILGLGLLLGRPSLALLLLCFGLVPVPAFVHVAASPNAESWLGEAMGTILRAIGAPVEGGGPLLLMDGRRFELVGTDAGLVTALCAAEYAWYAGACRGLELAQLVRRALAAAAVAVALQPILVLVCVATLPLGRPELGRFVLTHGVPLGLAGWAIFRRFGARRGASS